MKKSNRLVFGDNDSIEYARNAERHALEQQLTKSLLGKVRCSLCGGISTSVWQIDHSKKAIGWNFLCRLDCPNHGDAKIAEDTELWTDFGGKQVNF